MVKSRKGQVCRLTIFWKDGQQETDVYCENEAEVKEQKKIHKTFSNYRKAVENWYTPR